jgi:hypothetical protein
MVQNPKSISGVINNYDELVESPFNDERAPIIFWEVRKKFRVPLIGEFSRVTDSGIESTDFTVKNSDKKINICDWKWRNLNPGLLNLIDLGLQKVEKQDIESNYQYFQSCLSKGDKINLFGLTKADGVVSKKSKRSFAVCSDLSQFTKLCSLIAANSLTIVIITAAQIILLISGDWEYATYVLYAVVYLVPAFLLYLGYKLCSNYLL